MSRVTTLRPINTRRITTSQNVTTSPIIRQLTPKAVTPPRQSTQSVLTPINSGPDGGDDDPDDNNGPNDDDPDDGDPDPPANNEPPPDNNLPYPTAAEREEDRLLQLIQLLRPPAPPPKQKAKLREPDAFDGSDSRKLRPFLALCQLNFRNLPAAFPNDAAKVNYALSYLKGTALDWFEPAITHNAIDPWMTDWDEFVFQLESNFGPADPVGDAEEGLDNLRMRDGHKVAKYNVDFNKLAAITKWGDAPLRHAYYKGLPDRIKDSLVHVKKPRTLQELRAAAQLIDIRYWERRNEKSRDNSKPDKSDKSDNSANKNSDNRNNKKPNNNNNNNNGNKGNNNLKPGPNQKNNSNSGNKKTSDLADKLGKDGKLTKEERQRRFDNNLCMFCGRSGHIAKECSKASSSAAKARAAKAEEPKK